LLFLKGLFHHLREVLFFLRCQVVAWPFLVPGMSEIDRCGENGTAAGLVLRDEIRFSSLALSFTGRNDSA